MDREKLSSSDDEEEEEDRENLIDHNEYNPYHSSFEISELHSRIRRHFAFNKRYLTAISLFLFLIFIYFTVDLSRLFHGSSVVRIDPHADQMRESELHALYLLRNQLSGLSDLWNRTFDHYVLNSINSRTNSTSNLTIGRDNLSSLPTVALEEFRSALVQQIKINKEVQQSLLSTHRLGNVSVINDDNADPDFIGYGVDMCGKVDNIVRNRTIEWKPKPNRYLFAICVSGQMSNHLICLQKHMFFAALLDRVLVFPSAKFDYQYDRVIDIEYINECFGRKVVISYEEFEERRKNRLHIDRFICYIVNPPCYTDEDHIKKLKLLGLSMGKIESAWPEDAKVDEPKKRMVGDVLPKFSSDDEVIAIGDVFYANVEEEWVMQPGGPLAHKCKTVIQPSRLIVLTAQQFVQTFLGGNFVALHFRRHGFLKFWYASLFLSPFPL